MTNISDVVLWGIRVEQEISTNELADWIGVSQRTIQRAIKSLLNKKLIQIVRKNYYGIVNN